MGRARHCAICTADPAITSQVNAQIEVGCKQKLIHEQHPQFSISQISRHGRNCLVKSTANLSADPEADIWTQRLELAHAQAVADGNIAGQISACSAAGRALERARKAQAAKADAELPADCADWTEKQAAQFRAYADSVIKDTVERTKDDSNSSVNQVNWLYSLSAETLTIFRRVAANPDLLAAVQQLETTFIPQSPPTEATNVAAND